MGAKDPSEEQIRARAYTLYVQRGFEDGHAEEDWLIALEQLRQEQVQRVRADDFLDQPTPIPGQPPESKRGARQTSNPRAAPTGRRARN